MRVESVMDYAPFRRQGHPYHGKINTPIRRFEVDRLEHLHRQRPGEIQDFVAVEGGRPVGACTVCMGDGLAGFHDVGVVEAARNRGIGAALLGHAPRFARERGMQAAGRGSTAMGHGLNVGR